MNRLEFLRKEKMLSQSDVGNILGITSQAVGLYEKEKRDIPNEYLIKLASYFDVSIDYILGKSDVRNPKNEENDPLGLAKIGFSMDKYSPPTEKQKQQIRDLLEIILKDNKKDN